MHSDCEIACIDKVKTSVNSPYILKNSIVFDFLKVETVRWTL
jgi:hypothetical protein